MSTSGLLIASSLLGVVGLWLIATGWVGGVPSLAATVRRLRRDAEPDTQRAERDSQSPVDRLGAAVLHRAPIALATSTQAALRVLGRRLDHHVGLLVAGGLIGLVAPSAVVLALRAVGVIDEPVGPLVPSVIGVSCALLVPLVMHAAAIERSAEIRLGLRHQLSAFVDVVTMLLAGNTGHEGALRQAADAGDGRLFRELRRRMREVSTTGRSMVDALDLVAVDLDLDELGQIAATTRLAAGEGAPVARTLAAKCSTLRSTLASDHEAQARIRTDKITPPLVGMTLLFMAVIIYPALTL